MRWIALAVILTSCTSVHYVPCPTIVAYTNTDQITLEKEINHNPQPQVIRWIGDYIGLRDQIRACRNL